MLLLASLIGALLAVRGLQILLPSIQGGIAPLLGLILTVGGIAYHTGILDAIAHLQDPLEACLSNDAGGRPG